MRFILEGFHILDTINNYFNITHNRFRIKVLVTKINDNYTFEAIYYDTGNLEYQMFMKEVYYLQDKTFVNDRIEMFLEQLYLNMVFSMPTNHYDIYGKRIYTFRDILEYVREHDKLPEPMGEMKVDDYKTLKLDKL